MIEYKDEKLGKIKVLNVTEARANFATVLGDNHSHYIITKNNKPLRVIINYKEYEVLKRSLSSGAASVPLEDHETETAETKKKGRSKSRVKGMLESSMSLSKEMGDRKKTEDRIEAAKVAMAEPEPVIKEKVLPEATGREIKDTAPMPKREPVKVEKPEIKQEEKIEGQKQEAPQKVQEPEIQEEPSLTAEALLSADEGEDYFQTDEDEFSDDLLVMPDENVEEPVFEEQGAADEEVSPEETKEISKERSPEEEEYYKKYKKLYETLGVSPEANEEPEEEPEDIDAELNQRFNKEQEAMDQARFKAEIPPAQERDEPVAHKAELKEGQRASGDLPSLKDLLKDLEQEKLSGEEDIDETDDNMDDKEIDDLIQRITQD